MNVSRFISSIVYPQVIFSTWWIHALVVFKTSADFGLVISFLAAFIPSLLAFVFICMWINDEWDNCATGGIGIQNALFIRNTLLSSLHINAGWLGITGLLGAFSLFPPTVYALSTIVFGISSVGLFIWLMIVLEKVYNR